MLLLDFLKRIEIPNTLWVTALKYPAVFELHKFEIYIHTKKNDTWHPEWKV